MKSKTTRNTISSTATTTTTTTNNNNNNNKYKKKKKKKTVNFREQVNLAYKLTLRFLTTNSGLDY